MVKESTYLTRCKAVAQLEGGKTQSEVARGIGVSIRTVRRWWKKHQTGQECRISLLALCPFKHRNLDLCYIPEM